MSFLKKLWQLHKETVSVASKQLHIIELYERVLPLLNGETTLDCVAYANGGQWKSLKCRHMTKQPSAWRRVKFTTHLYFHRNVKNNVLAYKQFMLLYLVWMLNCLVFGGDLQAALTKKAGAAACHLLINSGMKMLEKVFYYHAYVDMSSYFTSLCRF